MQWATVRLDGTSFDNNQGVITNELYVDDSAAQVIFESVSWTADVTSPEGNKMAYVFYRPAHFNYTVTVRDSSFICTGLQFNRDVVMQNRVDSVKGHPSLFRMGNA